MNSAVDCKETASRFVDAIRRLDRSISCELEKIGLRESYSNVIRPLLDGGAITQLDIVKATGLKPPTISITLKNMERDGLVIREKSGQDKRETFVRLSRKGKQLCKKAAAATRKLQEKMLAGIEESELSQASAVLEKMGDNLL